MISEKGQFANVKSLLKAFAVAYKTLHYLGKHTSLGSPMLLTFAKHSLAMLIFINFNFPTLSPLHCFLLLLPTLI